MRYLLYCVLASPQYRNQETLLGLDGQPIYLVAGNGLSAAISKVFHQELTPDVSRILTYKEVVESFHRNHTVIPMRYGSLFDQESQVKRFLEERQEEYDSLLRELKDCVEMGIRVMIFDFRFSISDLKGEGKQSRTQNPQSTIPGRAYLAGRRAHYEQQERINKEMDIVIQRCRDAFAGLFVKYKVEYPSIQNQLLSLYFLVPRDSVEPLRKAFQHMRVKESEKILLSGPWPPYNFVML